MSNNDPRGGTCTVVVAAQVPCGLAHDTDRHGNAPPVQAASTTTATAAPPPSTHARPGRKSFAEALYRALLRLGPAKKAQVQAVFRFFKVRTELTHQQVQQVLVSALGLELVRGAWVEARREINEHVQAEVAHMLRPLGSGRSSSWSSSSSSETSASSSTSTSSSSFSSTSTPAASSSSSPPSSSYATATSLPPPPQQAAAPHTHPRPYDGRRPENEGEEEETRRVRPRPNLPRQSTMFWRAGDLMPSANTTTGASAAGADLNISVILASLSCPPRAPSLQRQDRSFFEGLTASSSTAAVARAAAAVAVASSSSSTAPSIFRASSITVSVDDTRDGGELEDEDLLLEDAPNAFVCPISLQLMTRAVVAGDGFSYQRDALNSWILKNRRQRKPLRSPMTNAPMAPFYTPSFTLRSMVGDYVEMARAKRAREAKVHVVEE